MFYLTKHDLALLLKFRTIRKLREILETVKLNAALHQPTHLSEINRVLSENVGLK